MVVLAVVVVEMRTAVGSPANPLSPSPLPLPPSCYAPQVVTDTEQTGKLLLQKGGLKRRVTIIPLNKISRNVVDAGRVRKAQQLATSKGGTAQLALELVGYDDEVKAAMEHVFGSTLVCDTLEVAKTLTFTKEVGRRTVTLEGDSFDPSGTLTGGSRQSVGAVLGKLQELNQAAQTLREKEAQCAELGAALAKQSQSSKEHDRLAAALEMKEHELRLLEERASQSVHGMYATQVAEQEAELGQAKEALAAARARAKEMAAKHKELVAQEAGLRKQREQKLKALEGEVKKAKKAQEAAAQACKAAEQRRKMLGLELKELEGENSSVAGQLQGARDGLDKLRAEVDELEAQLKAKREDYEAAK
jgi:structural maintenance of chromosome 2